MVLGSNPKHTIFVIVLKRSINKSLWKCVFTVTVASRAAAGLSRGMFFTNGDTNNDRILG